MHQVQFKVSMKWNSLFIPSVTWPTVYRL